MFLSIGFFAMIFMFGTLDFDAIFSVAPYLNTTAITIISLLLLLGAMAKSSQIGLHNWLPGSMEGPTPVSSLIHAATLVTAGLYLLMRSSPILEYSSTALFVITIIGSLTSFFAASSGLLQNDIKRIIAFSTISQLGYMVMAVGLRLTLKFSICCNIHKALSTPLDHLPLPFSILHFIKKKDIDGEGGLGE